MKGHRLINLIGSLLVGGGALRAIMLVGKDDYYTMELHEYRPVDWKGFVVAIILPAAGCLVWWIGDNFYIDIKIGRKRKR